MNSPRNLLWSQSSDLGDAHQRQLIHDYLDNLCVPLLGSVPCRERQSLRMEVECHLLALIDQHEGEGFDRQGATAAALHEHGEPWRIGQAFLDEWCRGTAQTRLQRYGGTAALPAFAYFGIAAVPTLLTLQVSTLLADHRACYDRLSSDSYLPLMLLAPYVSGGLTGATRPIRPVPATIGAVSLLILVSIGAGLLMLPCTDALSFALFQLFYWLPAGPLAAWLGARLALCYRRHQFLRMQRQATRCSR